MGVVVYSYNTHSRVAWFHMVPIVHLFWHSFCVFSAHLAWIHSLYLKCTFVSYNFCCFSGPSMNLCTTPTAVWVSDTILCCLYVVFGFLLVLLTACAHVDVDECARGAHNCSHDCLNIEGSYLCRCRAGYELDEDFITCIGTVLYTTAKCTLSYNVSRVTFNLREVHST